MSQFVKSIFSYFHIFYFSLVIIFHGIAIANITPTHVVRYVPVPVQVRHGIGIGVGLGMGVGIEMVSGRRASMGMYVNSKSEFDLL